MNERERATTADRMDRMMLVQVLRQCFFNGDDQNKEDASWFVAESARFVCELHCKSKLLGSKTSDDEV
jgi:hypothetical protein